MLGDKKNSVDNRGRPRSRSSYSSRILRCNGLENHLPFSLGKYGMSLCTLGMAAEFQHSRIKVNSLWPQMNIATQRLKDFLSREVYAGSRWPFIMADAAYELLQQASTGQFFIDEAVNKRLPNRENGELHGNCTGIARKMKEG